jgi:hypothetical protein
MIWAGFDAGVFIGRIGMLTNQVEMQFYQAMTEI